MTRQNKLQDPTEAAMSAIEEALRLDPSKSDGPASTEPRLPSTGENELKIELPRVESAPAAQAGAEAAAETPLSPPRPAIAPDTSSVVCAPRSADTGLVTANETGTSAADANHSRLWTRPSISRGPKLCWSVVNTTRPPVTAPPETAENSISCQTAVPRA